MQPDLFKHVKQQYEQQGPHMFDEGQFPALWRNIFELMIVQTKCVQMFCVIDALDECKEDAMEGFFRILAKSFAEKHNTSFQRKFKMILTSRKYPRTVVYGLEEVPCKNLDLDEERAVNKDLQKFIHAEAVRLAARWKASELESHIRQALTTGAEGTFLWVGIMARVLDNKGPSELYRVLKQIPKGLNALYSKTLMDIRADRKADAIAVLNFVALARCPLQLEELGALLDPTTHNDLPKARIVEDMVDFCEGLLRLRRLGISMVHSSLRDYLLSDEAKGASDFNIDEGTVESELATRCIEHVERSTVSKYAAKAKTLWSKLNTDARTADKTVENVRKQLGNLCDKFPLTDYGVRFWASHAANAHQDVYDLDRLLFRDQDIRDRIMLYQFAKQTTGNEAVTYKNSLPLLYFAIRFKANRLLEKVLQRGDDVGCQDSDSMTAIHYCVNEEWQKNFSRRRSQSSPPSDWDRFEVLKILLGPTQKPGEVIGAQDSGLDTMLHLAATIKTPGILELFLEALCPGSEAIGKRDSRGLTP